MKNNKWKLIVSSLIILLPIAFGLIVWNQLPEQIATHWGMDGNPDGWSSREVAVFGLPLFIFVLHWFCAFVTSRDPKNKDGNTKVKDLVLFITPMVSIMVSGMMYMTALGMSLRVEMIMMIFLGLLFIVLGNYMPKCRQNYTIGIKISWTLNSEENWNATHRFAGKLWMIGGALIMLLCFLPSTYAFIAFFAVAMAITTAPIIYSYNFYKKEAK